LFFASCPRMSHGFNIRACVCIFNGHNWSHNKHISSCGALEQLTDLDAGKKQIILVLPGFTPVLVKPCRSLWQWKPWLENCQFSSVMFPARKLHWVRGFPSQPRLNMEGYTKPILSKSTFDWNCLKVSPLVVVGQMPKSSLSEANMGAWGQTLSAWIQQSPTKIEKYRKNHILLMVNCFSVLGLTTAKRSKQNTYACHGGKCWNITTVHIMIWYLPFRIMGKAVENGWIILIHLPFWENSHIGDNQVLNSIGGRKPKTSCTNLQYIYIYSKRSACSMRFASLAFTKASTIISLFTLL